MMNEATTLGQAEGTAGRRSVPLATRFLVAFIAAAILPLVVVGTFQIANSYSIQRAQVGDLQREAARNTANIIDAYLEQMEDEMTLTAREWSREAEEARPALLDTLLVYNVGFETLTLVDKGGQEVARTSRYYLFGPEDLISRAGSPEFLTTQQGDRYLSPISVSEYGEPLVTLAIPLRNVRGEIEGMLSAEVNLKYMWDIIARMEIGRGGYAYVVDGEGWLIAHRDSSLVLQGLDLSELEGVRQALLGQAGVGLYTGLEGRRVIGSYQPLRRAGWFVLVETPMREALAGVYWGVMLGVAAVVVTLVLALLLGMYMARIVVRPVRRLQEGAEVIGGGDLAHRIDIQTRDEIGALARAFNDMAAQLQGVIGTLEQRVAERTAALERRAVQLTTAAEVSRAASSILDIEELLSQTVEFISDRFNLYYAGLFLLDEAGEWAVLQAATGEAGRQMLAQGHRLEVGGVSMVGWCTANALARIALDVGEEAVRFDNPLLPDTRSEMALPLISRGRVIGALDVQSTEEAAFTDGDIAVVQTMADQLANAIENARLVQQAQESLEAERRAYGELSREAWAQMVRTRPDLGQRYDPQGILPTDGRWREEMKLAVQKGETVLGEGRTSAALAAPIKVRDQVIGVLDAHKPTDAGEWTAEEIALMETLTDQLGVALESARLYQDTQRRAAQERLTGEVTARMRETLDLETVLKTAVDEVYQALGLDKIVVRLATEEVDGDSV